MRLRGSRRERLEGGLASTPVTEARSRRSMLMPVPPESSAEERSTMVTRQPSRDMASPAHDPANEPPTTTACLGTEAAAPGWLTGPGSGCGGGCDGLVVDPHDAVRLLLLVVLELDQCVVAGQPLDCGEVFAEDLHDRGRYERLSVGVVRQAAGAGGPRPGSSCPTPDRSCELRPRTRRIRPWCGPRRMRTPGCGKSWQLPFAVAGYLHSACSTWVLVQYLFQVN